MTGNRSGPIWRLSRYRVLFGLPLMLLLASACSPEQRSEQISASDTQQAEESCDNIVRFTDNVEDRDGLFSDRYIEQLSQRLKKIKQQYGPEIAVVTISSLENMTIEQYSLKLGNCSNIGSAKYDDGLLIVLAARQRQARIELGYGMELLFTDDDAKKIIESRMTPRFRETDYQAGIDAGLEEIEQKIAADWNADMKAAAARQAWSRRSGPDNDNSMEPGP